MSKKKSPSEKIFRYRIEKKLLALEKLTAELREILHPSQASKKTKPIEITPELRRDIVEHISLHPGCSLLSLQRQLAGRHAGDSWSGTREITVQLQREGLLTIRTGRRRKIRQHWIAGRSTTTNAKGER